MKDIPADGGTEVSLLFYQRILERNRSFTKFWKFPRSDKIILQLKNGSECMEPWVYKYLFYSEEFSNENRLTENKGPRSQLSLFLKGITITSWSG